MPKITVREPNMEHPLKQRIVDFNVAFATSDVKAILDMMADDATWQLVGSEPYSGKPAISAALQAMGLEDAHELIIETIVCEGNRCAANGVMVFDGLSVAFCDVYQFDSPEPTARVLRLISYGIDSK